MSNVKKFTNADKNACLPIIDVLIECAKIARANGVLALEEFVKKQEDDFLRFAMMLIVDGTDPEIVIGVLEILINADNHTGVALLKRRIIMEGTLSAQAGENPIIMGLKLNSMLGEEYLRKAGHFPTIASKVSKEMINQQLGEIITNAALSGNPRFDEIFQKLSNRDIQCVMREVDCKDLAIALKGCATETGVKILGNISKRLAMIILDTMEQMGPIRDSDVENFQGRILEIINRLAKTGEIIN